MLQQIVDVPVQAFVLSRVAPKPRGKAAAAQCAAGIGIASGGQLECAQFAHLEARWPGQLDDQQVGAFVGGQVCVHSADCSMSVPYSQKDFDILMGV